MADAVGVVARIVNTTGRAEIELVDLKVITRDINVVVIFERQLDGLVDGQRKLI